MQFGINLLPTQKPGLKERRIRQQIKLIGGAVLLVYIIFMASWVALSFFISSSERKLKQDLKQMETEIKRLEQKESFEVTLKGRVEVAKEILETRTSQKELLSRVQDLLLPGVSLTEIVLAAEQVNFSGEAQNVQVLGDFLDQFEKQGQVVSVWSPVRLKSLTRTSKGIYSFSFEASPVF